MMKISLSEKTKEGLVKVGKGALIALAGAVLTYMSTAIMNIPVELTIGDKIIDLTPLLVAAWSVVANMLRKVAGL